jgi:hypothetical protein
MTKAEHHRQIAVAPPVPDRPGQASNRSPFLEVTLQGCATRSVSSGGPSPLGSGGPQLRPAARATGHAALRAASKSVIVRTLHIAEGCQHVLRQTCHLGALRLHRVPGEPGKTVKVGSGREEAA